MKGIFSRIYGFALLLSASQQPVSTSTLLSLGATTSGQVLNQHPADTEL